MSGAGALPKVEVQGVMVIRDSRGWVRLSEHMQANPHSIKDEIKAAMPREQLEELELAQ